MFGTMFELVVGVSQTKKSIDEMKRTSALVVVLLAVAAVAMVGFSSCSKNKTKLLIKEWTIEQVKVAGIDVSEGVKGAKFNPKKDHTYTITADQKSENGAKLLGKLKPEGKWEMDDEGTWVKLDGMKYTITDERDFTRIHLSNGVVELTLK